MIFILSTALCLSSYPSDAVAQRWLGMGGWEGFVEFGFEWDDQKISSKGAKGLAFRRIRFDEKIGLRNRWFIMDPRFLTINTSSTVGFFQDRLSILGERTSSNGRLLGYDVTATILPEKPITLTLFSNQAQNTISREFGGTSEIARHHWGGTLSLKRLKLPSTFSFRRELLEEEARFGVPATGREETRNVFTYDGRRAWETSDLSARYEFLDMDDRLSPRLGYRSHTVGVHHRVDFGKVFSKTLTSSLRYFTRAGRLDFSSIGVTEDLRARHSETLSTGYQYSFSRFSTQGADTTSHTALFSLQHQLYESLRTDLGLRGTFSSFPTGRERIYGGRLDFNYQKRILWGGRLLAGLGGSYEIQDNRFEDGELSIFQEKHTARIGSPFRLIRSQVILASIIVTDEAGTTIFEEGLDYVVRLIGEFAEIDIVLTGRIKDGQALLVDYRAVVSPSIRFSTSSIRFNTGLDFSWIFPYYAFERSAQDLLSGLDAEFLEDLTIHTVGLQLRWDQPRSRASLLHEYTRQDSRRLAFDSLRFSQSLSYTPHRAITLSLSLNEILSDFRVPERKTTRIFGRSNIIWRPWTTLSVEPFTSAALLKDNTAMDETSYKAGFRVRWSLGKLEVNPCFEYDVRKRDGSRSEEIRMRVRVIRRF